MDDPTSLAEVLGKTFGHMVVAHYALCDNAKGRLDKKVDEMIRLLAEHYNPPRADRAVWRPSENFNV